MRAKLPQPRTDNVTAERLSWLPLAAPVRAERPALLA